MIDVALYQPDIAPNAANIMRTCACLGCPVHIIEPAGFVLSERGFRRAAMDYARNADLTRHESWSAFQVFARGRRVVLITTGGDQVYSDFSFASSDIVLMGRETAGVPDLVHRSVNARLVIPMQPEMRSLNVAAAAAMVLGEALRQTIW